MGNEYITESGGYPAEVGEFCFLRHNTIYEKYTGSLVYIGDGYGWIFYPNVYIHSGLNYRQLYYVNGNSVSREQYIQYTTKEGSLLYGI
jgi:hypothetical protein